MRDWIRALFLASVIVCSLYYVFKNVGAKNYAPNPPQRIRLVLLVR